MFSATTKGALPTLLALMLACSACAKKANAPGTPDAPVQAHTEFVPGSLYAQAQQLHASGNLAEAAKTYQRGLKLTNSPHDARAAYELAQIQVELNDAPAATTAYREAWFSAPEGDAKEKLHATFLQLIARAYYLEKVSEPGVDPATRLAAAQAITKWLAGKRFELHGSEVKDLSTGLTWQRCLVGQTMSDGIQCEGNPELVRWDEANGLPMAGWRLPTANELKTLVDARGTSWPRINLVAFPLEKHPYYINTWTSENAGRVLDYRYVTFAYGTDNPVRDDHKDLIKTVRLVRASP